jgi:hypothetical protein
MSNSTSITLHELGAETASGTGDSSDLGSDLLRTAAKLQLHVLAVSGSDTPTLTVTLQTSPDETTWRTVGSFTAATAVAKPTMCFGGLDRYVRVIWTISGTDPSFSFEVAGDGHVIYAELEDLNGLGIPQAAMSNVSTSDKYQCLIAASSVADVHLNRVFTLPILAWGESLRRIVSAIAAFDLRRVKGFKPEGTDKLIQYSYEGAKLDLRMLEDKTKPPDIVDSTPDTFDAGVVIYSDNTRGW